MHDALDLRELLADEVVQQRESGHDVRGTEPEIRAALDGDAKLSEVEELYDRLMELPRGAGWPYQEPSSWPEIEALLPAEQAPPGAGEVDDATLADRLRAAWFGRCAGCNLGKPVEGFTPEQVRRYLELAGAWPLDDYLPALDPMPEGLALRRCWTETTHGRITHMARDDDIDYTILALHILESHGFGFATGDVAAEWLDHLPFTQTYTAERVAYRNLVHNLRPPATATHRNPYREWIGAQIRGDLWGYVSPAAPRRAAELACRDAALSHVANGIYGELWVAALLAACFTAADARAALERSLEHVPPRSRLAAALRDVLDLHAGGGLPWQEARDQVAARYGHYHWVHTIPNAAVVAVALLWGEGDFARTVGLAVQAGWDTDCNGATAGSVFGALHGTAALPERFVAPLGDRIRSAIGEFDNARISDLADRTFRLARPRARGA
jgi:ADP-ribosylglycohydrolase